MNTDVTVLFLGVLFSSIGMGYLIYGKRQKHRIAFYSGIALMIYPYFVSGTLLTVLTGIALMLVPKFVHPD